MPTLQVIPVPRGVGSGARGVYYLLTQNCHYIGTFSYGLEEYMIYTYPWERGQTRQWVEEIMLYSTHAILGDNEQNLNILRNIRVRK